jgi:hypothetical protein
MDPVPRWKKFAASVLYHLGREALALALHAVAALTGSPFGSVRRFIEQWFQRRVLERFRSVRIVEHLLKRMHQLLRLGSLLDCQVWKGLDVVVRLRLDSADGILNLSNAEFIQPLGDFIAMLQPRIEVVDASRREEVVEIRVKRLIEGEDQSESCVIVEQVMLDVMVADLDEEFPR